MISIKYQGTVYDSSGYGQSNRADIMALFVNGVNLTVDPLYQTQFRTTHDIQEKIVNYLEGRDIPYKIKIFHITPDLYPKYMEKGIYQIGRLVWETDKLPKEWIDPCNQMNEIWTTTEQHAEIMKNNGINVPIYCFPEPIMIQEVNEKITPFITKFKKDFTFYSIFQWIDRKNPRGLLRAYWKAFEGKDDITLLLKTYRVTYNENEFKLIEQDIEKWKKELGFKKFPKIWLVKKLLKGEEMKKLHMMGDCFVNPSSGEGWCRPMSEAMLYGKTVVSGNNGGITDLIDDNCYYKVPSKLSEVVSQSWIPWYRSDQKWKVLDEDKLAETMLKVYKDTKESKLMGIKAQDFVLKNFSLETVGRAMSARLEAIYEKI